METESRRESWIRPELVRVLGAASLWAAGFSSFFLLPKFLSVELRSTPEEIGWVAGVFGAATLVLTPLAGRTADRLPSRVPFLVGAALVVVSGLALTGIDRFGPALLALRVVQALSYALVLTVVGVLVAALAPPERLGQALGLSGASMLVTNAAVPALLEPLARALGWAWVFVAAALLGAAAMAIGVSLPDGRSLEPGPEGARASLFRRALVRQYAAVIAVAGLAFGTVFTFQAPLALAAGRETIGGFFVAFAAGALLMRTAFGTVPDRAGRHRVAAVCLGLYGLSVASMAWIDAAWLEGTGFAFGVAHGLLYPSLNAMAISSVARWERGRVLAVFTGAFSLGMAATFATGWLADRAGLPAAFQASALLTLGAALALGRSRAFVIAGAGPSFDSRTANDPGTTGAPPTREPAI